jgi:hypothetical protein
MRAWANSAPTGDARERPLPARFQAFPCSLVGPESALSGPRSRLPQSITETIRSRPPNWLLCAKTGHFLWHHFTWQMVMPDGTVVTLARPTRPAPSPISSAFSARRRRCDRSRVGGRAPLGARRLVKRPASPDGTPERSCFVMAPGASRTTAPAVISPPVTPGRFRLPRRPDPGARSVRRRPGRARGPCPGPAPC